MVMRKRWLSTTIIVAVLLIVPLLASAQDTAPEPTPIPIIGDDEDDSAAPALPGGDSPTPEPSTTTEDGSGTTTDGATTDGAVTTDSTATTGNQCPTLVQENFTLAEEFVCSGIQAGNVCAVSGTIDTVFAGDGVGSLSNPDDRVAFTSLDELGLRSTGTTNNAWAVVRGRLQLISTDGAVPVAPDVIAFGDLTVLDRGQVAGNGAAEGTVIAQRGMVVRRTPENQGVVVWQLQPNEIITVTGITPDRQWIRMEIPSFYGGVGWVYSPYIDVAGGADALEFVTVESPAPNLAPPEFGPMQSVLLITSPIADECGTDIPDSGLLMQSPNGVPDAVRFEVNGVEIQFNGTIFVQAQAESTLSVTILEGTATQIAGGGDASGNAGNRLVTSMDANLAPVGTPRSENVDLGAFNVLPIRLLPRQVALGSSPAPANTGATTEQTNEQATQQGGFGTPPPTTPVQDCVVTAPAEGEARNVRSGPGLAYPVIRNLANNASETANGQASDDANFVWYQLVDGGWVRFDSVSSEGPCDGLPVVQAPPPPQPTATPEASTATEETTAPATGTTLASSTLGNVTCPDGNLTGSTTSDGSALFVEIGGTWTANAGTSISVTTNGGQLRPELGSYIQFVGSDDTVIAESNDQRNLAFTFSENVTFALRLSAGNGDVVFVRVSCTG